MPAPSLRTSFGLLEQSSIALEQLLPPRLLQASYTVRSEHQLMEELGHIMCTTGLGVD
jgi:hypothetical protein